jgi:hypothetical protein
MRGPSSSSGDWFELSGSGFGLGSGLGLGLEGEKEMLNLKGELEREEQVRRGRVRNVEVSLFDLVKQSDVIAIVAAEPISVMVRFYLICWVLVKNSH